MFRDAQYLCSPPARPSSERAVALGSRIRAHLQPGQDRVAKGTSIGEHQLSLSPAWLCIGQGRCLVCVLLHGVARACCRGSPRSQLRAHLPALAETSTPCCSSVSGQALALADPAASPTDRRRSPIDDKYLWGLVWSERVNISIALICAITATCSNLASPVISGYLLEILAGRQPVELYPKVRAQLTAGCVCSQGCSRAIAPFCAPSVRLTLPLRSSSVWPA